MRHPAGWGWWAAACLAVACGVARGQDADAIMRALDRAARAGDLEATERGLDDLWEADARRGRDAAWQLLVNGTMQQHPIALAAFRRHATPEELATVARALDRNAFGIARVWLVRSIGMRPVEAGDESAREAARQFLDDNDRLVRAAAALSLADLGDVASIAQYTRRLGPVPSTVSQWRGDDGGAEQMAMYGAIRTLTGLCPKRPSEVSDWLAAHPGGAPPPRPADGQAPTTRVYADGFLATEQFGVEVAIQGAPEDGRMHGLSGWDEIADGFDRAAREVGLAAAPIFGPIHLPHIRLVLADERSLTRFGGPSRGYAGFASGNKVVMLFQSWDAGERILRHEFVHIVHDAHTEDQPRWLSEGLADSLAGSPRSSLFLDPKLRGSARSIVDGMGDRPVSEVLRWDSGGSSGGNEPYAPAHAVLDYFRFGPFTAPEARLFVLMGRLGRGGTSERAVEELYLPLEDLDRGFLEWFDGGQGAGLE